MIWNGILSLACGSFLWWMRGVNQNKDKLEKMIYETKLELSENYVSKKEFGHRTDDIMKRFDKLEEKLDTIFLRVSNTN
tara:strand:+ start:1352 stop:1588 length:237 start_codon:yes stop_codon:yes gene_type:complete